MSNISSKNINNNKNSIYILKEQKSFNVKHIFECGQCFRWNYDALNNRYIGVVYGHVITVKEEKNKYIFVSTMKTNKELEVFVKDYFNLNSDYDEIKLKLLKNNSIDILGSQKTEEDKLLKHNIALKEAIEYGYGIRILKQELWETIMSFIISANNNIPRIKKIIDNLSFKYGKKIIFEDNECYSFPTAEELKNVTVKDLRDCGLGYRDKSVFELVRFFLNNRGLRIDYNSSIKDLKKSLMKLKGVGPKVADCVLLFGFNKYEVFPIDVWVRRVMNEIYFNKEDEKQLTNEEIINFINKRYGEYAGIAQQYLFYWKREKNGTK